MGNLLSPNATSSSSTGNTVTFEMYGAIGDGITDDTIPIQKAFNAGVNIIQGLSKTYYHVSTIIIPNDITFAGTVNDPAANKGTVLLYGGNSDNFQINNPINSGSTNANVTIHDVCFKSKTVNTGKACIASVGSHYVRTQRCTFAGNDYGVIHDQDEITVDEDNTFYISTGATGGIWLVNGPDHTPGANGFFTNVNHINRNEFSPTVNGTGIGVIDDGGNCHTYTGNNFNQLLIGVRVTSGIVIDISKANSFDNCITGIATFLTKYNGVASTFTYSLNIAVNSFSGTGGIVFAANSVKGLNYVCNEFNISGTPDNIGAVNATASTQYLGSANVQIGAGGQPTNNFAQIGTYTPTWLSSGVAPSLGNGTILGTWYRNGTSVTVCVELSIGSTSTMGTGDYSFGALPYVCDGTNSSHNMGSGIVYQNSSGNYYVIATSMINGGSAIFMQSNAANSQVGAASPIAFVSGDKIRITLTYPTHNWR